MTNRERECATLNFQKLSGRGAVEETFYPWNLTMDRFCEDGLPTELWAGIRDREEQPWEKYLNGGFGDPVLKYESYMGFDSVYRVKFLLPYGGDSGLHANTHEEWAQVKAFAEKELAKWFTRENMEKAYGFLREGHSRGDYSVRMNIEGFFWIPRELMGVEEHLYAFYDEPELLHEMNTFTLDVYKKYLRMALEVIQPDLIYIQEDLSGKNGPMISPECFREFVGDYYRELIPMLREMGCGNVFVDTDGDFKKLIPEFIEAGVDGFLPMDVNAGMDINEVRKEFPTLKFVGGYNKLEINQGPEAIDREFERILPVIRQGGYIPGADHQVAPAASLENYRYYIKRLHECMQEAGADINTETCDDQSGQQD